MGDVRCRLTNLGFQFNTSMSEGIHPLAFSYTLPRVKRILHELLKNEKNISAGHIFLIRVSILLYLDEELAMPFGSVYFRHEDNPAYTAITITKEIKKVLKFFSEPVPNVNKLKIKNLSCKEPVESLQDMFNTYQIGINYTPFKRYLQTTLLNDSAIKAIMEYELSPNQHNLMLLQLSLSGQECLLSLSDRESDYYNNRKMARIIKVLDETSIALPEELRRHVPVTNHATKKPILSSPIEIKIRSK
uniref:Uncharacterized protein n=1 Tax=uncultured Thiotrichaceae bacterium TaxID=298394 RepID=A0A6S6UEV8_9GAMM|nr:MAG: Unknown protein [uncultured Thiotrichaceae bacterium]